ncbi:BlaI/MecI/CopY family transcriptional regulator [Nonomuraea sp. NPDC050536]|uniref:BlaI/MecI/CopY family transcriptional regulator n=1 Tax=Nonomuraea sp. NPDC050536 TaxID=3364366 RepID=UPI0037CA515B
MSRGLWMTESQPRQPREEPRRRTSGRRPPGALEQEILDCLTASDRPLTPGEVLTRMGGELAYTTVMTTLARLHKRGLTEREPSGRAYAYRIASDAEAARSIAVAAQMRRLLGTGSDRAGVLTHFIADLGPEDERLLAELLRDFEAGRQAGGAVQRTPNQEADDRPAQAGE